MTLPGATERLARRSSSDQVDRRLSEQLDEPNPLLDITQVWDKKRAAIECMTGQEHLWEYYTHVALRRGNQCRRNGGNKGCTHAEGYQRIFPETPEVLA